MHLLNFILPFVALANPVVPVDGPYVRYTDNQVVVTQIVRDDDLLLTKTRKYPVSEKANIELQVTPEGHADWAFTVKLKPELQPEKLTYAASAKALFLSDIEGEFANFRQILLAAKVIDTSYHWTYGNGALVIAGDLFDRGKDVVPELWLLYKLEDEAQAAGGHVHVLLGNHDIMNLSGDPRYTDAKYFKDAWLMNIDVNDLFSANTELGRWLRSKNVIEKAGAVLIMHGGLSPALGGLTLEEINKKYQPYDQQVRTDRDAPFWFRGYFKTPKIGMASVDSTLAQYNCKWIVVGHTIVKWNIASFYEGKVIGVDVDEHKGKAMAALLENGNWFTIDDTGERKPLIYKPANDRITEKDIL